MKHPKVVKVFLILCAIIGIYVGGGLLFFPIQFQAQSHIVIGENISQLSETRAPGAAVFFTSIVILLGVFRARWMETSLLLSALFFLSYGLGRMLSLLMDGMPDQALFAAMIIELLIGLIALILLVRGKQPQAA